MNQTVQEQPRAGARVSALQTRPNCMHNLSSFDPAVIATHLGAYLARPLLLGFGLVCLMLVWPATPALAQGGISVELLVSTQGGEDTVFNGEDLAYTILVSNNSNQAVTDLLVLDVLPESVLDSVQCLDDPAVSVCHPHVDEQVVPEPLGGTVTITTTRQLTWNLARLGPGEQQQFSFLARVVGQTDGAVFGNIAYVTYRQGGEQRTANSPEVRLTVRVRIEQGGQTVLSETPTWFSSDVGGTLSMDWADFDGDGDLDLVLGSTLGTTVYRNNNGRLEQFWSVPSRAFGVRWADVTGNGSPELIVVGEIVGEATDNIAQQPGNNFIYRFNPAAAASNRRFEVYSDFESAVQLVRLEVGDFTGDGRVDLVTSTNAINPECPVELYVNNGSGHFNEEPPRCVSRAASAALKPIDFNNDGHLDLILGQFPNRVRVLLNDGEGNFSQSNSIGVEESVLFLPYDFAWADIDGDGYLDLAAAYPLLREARIYRNVNGERLERIATIRTDVFLTPYALDWGDFNGDGRLDLAVADVTPRIYSYTGQSGANAFERFFALEDGVVRGQIWSMRAVDVDGDGDIDLVVTDRDGPSLVISNFLPPLASTLKPIRGVPPFNNLGPASSVAWADVSGDGTLDLILGAGPPEAGPAALNTKLFFNSDAQFLPETVRTYSGFGPVATTYGDLTANGSMDLVLGTSDQVMVYMNGDFLSPAWSLTLAGRKTVALGDVSGDGSLDLIVGRSLEGSGQVYVYFNNGSGHFGTVPGWTSGGIDPVHSVALADYDRDGFLDLAVGINGPNRIYRNTRDNGFTLAWTSPQSGDTRAVAWGDHNGSGAPDLAVGNYDAPNRIYSWEDGTFRQVWVSQESLRTTSLAWGDWDNDGDLDLAVGNYGQRDQIYVNLGSRPGSTQMAWLWSSSESLNTTGVAWGDMDGDGDLDLAISQDGQALSGIYVNNYRRPAHIVGGNSLLANVPLLNVPSYVALNRPGFTNDAYLYSSAEILAGPNNPFVEVRYRAFNPSGARAGGVNDVGAQLYSTRFEYSVDGGGVWRRATAATNANTGGGCREGQVDINRAVPEQLMLISHITPEWAQEILTLRAARPFVSVDDMIRIVGLGLIRLQDIKDEGIACTSTTDGAASFATASGREGLFVWNARQDQVISDDVRFRVTIVDANRPGPVQQVSASAISPPFRVRGVSCVWPEGPFIQASPVLASGTDGNAGYDVRVEANRPIQFTGRLNEGTGAMEYDWDFGNGFTAEGQVAHMTFSSGTYTVRMSVVGTPCPQNRERIATLRVQVGTGVQEIFVPALVSNHDLSPAPTQVLSIDDEPENDMQPANSDIVARAALLAGGPLAQITGLNAVVQADTGHIWLRWDAAPENAARVRIYRGGRDDAWPLTQLVELDAATTAFVDEEAACDQVYYVTAWNRSGESLPSTTSYYTPPCR